MNILFLEGDMSRRGGTERMTALLSASLSQTHTIHIISLHQATENVFYTLHEAVSHSVLKSSGMIRQMMEIRRFIRRNRIDVVINVDTGMGIYGICAAFGTKTKVITWEHANFMNNWNSRVFPILRKIAAKHSDAVVVLTEKDKVNYLENTRGCKPVTVIPNPAEQHNCCYDTTSKIILSAGLLVAIKRFDLIPEIGREIFAKHPDWKWIICGDGSEREVLQEKICAYGLEQHILLPGCVTDMAQMYRQSAMYVMTSRMEGLPMVLLEAKSYGLPLVSFDIMTGPSDIIRDGENGYLVEDGNLPEITARILELIENASLRQAFSEKSELDMEKFTIESVVEKWEKLISTL